MKVARLISEVFGVQTANPNAGVMVENEPGAMTPSIDPHYVFDPDLLKQGLMWQDERFCEQNFILTGPTGAGKSSFIEQLCARLGVQVWRVMCHGRMEFQELLGGFKLVAAPGGGTETIWVDGPLIQAARAGGTLLLDEGNFISPAAIGGLNSVLDGAPILIPETGELVRPMPGFRVAFTGNAVNGAEDSASYRGIQRMNMALLDRFMTAEVGYMPALQEAILLNRFFPQLTGDTVQVLVKIANSIRTLHTQGDIEATMSTRVLIRWGKLYLNAPKQLSTPRQRALWAINLAHLRAVRPDERMVIEQLVELEFA